MDASAETAPPVARLLTPAVVAVITSIASQVALISALLYFYGRVWTRAMYDYFGVDASLLGLSNTDYVISSLNATLPPVIICALAIVLILSASRHLDRGAEFVRQRPGFKRAGITAAAGVAAVCVVVLLNGVSRLPTNELSRGYPMPIAVLGLVVSIAVGRRLLPSQADHSQSSSRLWSLILATFALGSVLWLTDYYVAEDGARRGREVADNLRASDASDFVLYSTEPLAIRGPLVMEHPIENSRYRIRYTGLRLLIRTPREYVIAPAGWQRGADPVFFVPVDATVRLDMVAHGEP